MAFRAFYLVVTALFVVSASGHYTRARSLLQTSCQQACEAAQRTDPNTLRRIVESNSGLCSYVCNSGTGERIVHASVPSKCNQCIEIMVNPPPSCSKSTRDFSGNTALHTAARLCRMEVGDALNGMGFNVHAQNSAYNTPLCVASRQNNENCGQVVRSLMKAGADECFVCSDGKTAIGGCVNKVVCDVMKQDQDDFCN